MRLPTSTLLLSALLLLGAESTQPAGTSPPADPAAPAESTQPGSGASLDAALGNLAPPFDLHTLPLLPPAERQFTPETPVGAVLAALGASPPSHARPLDVALVNAGRELFVTGRTTDPSGQRTRRLSPAFECTDCHNVVVEDPDLRVSDPEVRLDFVVGNDLAFLPGTTMAGVVDRRSWFNGDYVKKYGALVEPANTSLVEAIQLCSIECSQGRALTDWEMEAMLAYFASIALRWGDLPTEGVSLALAETVARGDNAAHQEAVRADVASRFLPASPATFGPDAPEHGRDEPGYGLKGDPARGAAVFGQGCLHCHGPGGVSDYKLSPRRGRLAELRSNQGRNDKWSYYVAVRHGTKPFGGHYMPLYPLERLSDQQVEDLRAFIDEGAKRRK